MNGTISKGSKIAGAVSLTLAAIGLIVGFGGVGGAAGVQLQFGATYQSLPSKLMTLAGVQLNQLDASQAAAVTITPTEALATAGSFVGTDRTSQPGVTNVVSLGSFTDPSFKQRQASGSYALVASNLASYVVTFSGLSLPTLNGNEEVSHDTVVVNSVTGSIVEGLRYH